MIAARRASILFAVAVVCAGATPPAAATGAADSPGAASDHTCYERSGRRGCIRSSAKGASPNKQPLIVFLNGYGGEGREDVLGLAPAADRAGILYAWADGAPDKDGRNTWVTIDRSASQAREPDDTDVEFIAWLLDRIVAEWNADPARVFLAGWSLGGFMALRFACARPDKVAAVVSYAGSMDAREGHEGRCRPSLPVSVLLVHGAADEVVSVEGGLGRRINLRYASADSVFRTWTTLDGCRRTRSQSIGLPASAFGGAVTATRATNCKLGTSVSLWKVEGGKHRPNLTAEGADAISTFLLRHHRHHRVITR